VKFRIVPLLAFAVLILVSPMVSHAMVTMACETIMSRPARTGEEVGITYRDVQLRAILPAGGTFNSSPVGPVGTDVGLEVCHVESGAWIRIGLDGREVLRAAPDAATNAMLDQILTSVRIGPAPPSRPVSPPHTGDGGLLSAQP
jgi:hypothetical protein